MRGGNRQWPRSFHCRTDEILCHCGPCTKKDLFVRCLYRGMGLFYAMLLVVRVFWRLTTSGLEILCATCMVFEGDVQLTGKAKNLNESTFATCKSGNPHPQPKKKWKIGEEMSDFGRNLSQSQPWVQCSGVDLLEIHRNENVWGAKLNDPAIIMAPQLRRVQFPKVAGLQSTILQCKMNNLSSKQENSVHIVHVVEVWLISL